MAKVKPVNKILMEKINFLKRKNKSTEQIKEILNDCGFNVSYEYIRVLALRSKKKHLKKTKAIPDYIKDFIDHSTVSRKGFKSCDILTHEIYQLFNRTISSNCVRQNRKKLGYRYRRTKKAWQLSEEHKMQRLIWCLNNQDNRFENYVFCDESFIRYFEIPLYQWRKKGENGDARVNKNLRIKLNIWSALSYQGLGPIVTFQQNVNSDIYRTILGTYLVPFCAEKYNLRCILHQDNATTHTSVLCRTFLTDSGIEWARSPPYAPDLNPIEMVWNDLKAFIKSKLPENEDEVLEAIQEYKSLINIDKCRMFIAKMRENINKVILKNGDWAHMN